MTMVHDSVVRVAAFGIIYMIVNGGYQPTKDVLIDF